MQNYMKLEGNSIQTSFGVFAGVDTHETYSGGELKSVFLSEKNMVVTEAGELVPWYTQNERRKYKPSVEFDKSGMIISVELEEQQEVITPIGELPAELIKFYPTGELHRVFILDGQLSGFNSVEDERKLNVELTFDLGFTEFSAMITGICFFKSGDIRSITLFPDETIVVNTPLGKVETETGLSLYESGNLKSVEPKETVIVDTPIGKITAYDAQHININADSNSLVFTEDGDISSLISCDSIVYVQYEDETMDKFTPYLKQHPLYDGEYVVKGIKIEFDYSKGEVIIEGKHIDMATSGFTIQPFYRNDSQCSPEDCKTCSICNK